MGSWLRFIIYAIMAVFLATEGSIADEIQHRIPDYVVSPPRNHFAGISPPSPSLRSAREAALSDVAKQILHAIGGNYDHHYRNQVSGDIRNPVRTVNDDIRIKASGLIRGLEQNIVNTHWIRNGFGHYTCSVLVHYPEQTIREMRRLSKGAKIIVTLDKDTDGHLTFDLSEINGVAAVVSSATVHIHKTNRWAEAISFFIWPVPQSVQRSHTIAFKPVHTYGNSATLHLQTGIQEWNISDLLLGAKISRLIKFQGFDEIGRPVQTTLSF